MVALRQNSITGQSGFATSIPYFLLYINFIEGFKQIKCDDKNILIYQLASDYQINNGTAGWSVLGGFALGGCLCQIMLVRKILGFSALTNQPSKSQEAAMQQQQKQECLRTHVSPIPVLHGLSYIYTCIYTYLFIYIYTFIYSM